MVYQEQSNKCVLIKYQVQKTSKMNTPDITIVITASFVPSHPNICLIDETLKSLSLISECQNFPTILAHDYNGNIQYAKYLDNLSNFISDKPNIRICTTNSRQHLSGNIRNALNIVKTKYLLIVQHDLPFIRQFEILQIIDDLQYFPEIKHLRFNRRNNIKVGFDDSTGDIFGLQIQGKNYTYTRTPGWSDQNHLCLASYYRNVIFPELFDANVFMENILKNKPHTESGHKKYGTFLFGAYNDPPTIKHINGKKYKCG
jgi:hypothetical protein